MFKGHSCFILTSPRKARDEVGEITANPGGYQKGPWLGSRMAKPSGLGGFLSGYQAILMLKLGLRFASSWPLGCCLNHPKSRLIINHHKSYMVEKRPKDRWPKNRSFPHFCIFWGTVSQSWAPGGATLARQALSGTPCPAKRWCFSARKAPVRS